MDIITFMGAYLKEPLLSFTGNGEETGLYTNISLTYRETLEEYKSNLSLGKDWSLGTI